MTIDEGTFRRGLEDAFDAGAAAAMRKTGAVATMRFDVHGRTLLELERAAAAAIVAFLDGADDLVVSYDLEAEPKVEAAQGEIVLWAGHVRAVVGPKVPKSSGP